MSQNNLQQGFTPNDIEQNKIYAGLGYIIFFIPLLIKDSKFARFHANQILLLLIPSVVINFVCGIILTVLTFSLHLGLASIVGFILGAIDLLISVIGIINMVNAFQGKARRIPVLGKMTILKGSNDIEVEDMIHNEKLDNLSNSFQNISFGGIVCPNCGAQIGKGKKFCPKCGSKITVAKKCIQCGAEIELGKKFCPDCGTPVPEEKKEESIKPVQCTNCGSELPRGKKFCPDCGAPAPEEKKEEPPKPVICTNCGSEIPTGKKFCPDCGTKTSEE